MGVQEMFGLSGTKALVLGAVGTIGRSIALGLAEAGADVCVTSLGRSRDEEFAVNSVANEIWVLQRRTRAFVIDAADPAQIRDAVDEAAAEMGGLTLLVNNADEPLFGASLNITNEYWLRTFAINAGAPFVAAQAAAERMLGGDGGRIINVVSVLGERGVTNGAVYGAAKAAVISLTRSLSIEWGRGEQGVRVNAIGLGWMEGAPGLDDEALLTQLARYVPAGRLGDAGSVAALAVYLASPACTFMSGEIVWVDGAVMART